MTIGLRLRVWIILFELRQKMANRLHLFYQLTYWLPMIVYIFDEIDNF